MIVRPRARATTRALRRRLSAAAICLALAATACDSQPTPSGTALPSAQGSVPASIEVTPAAVLLPAAGESRVLAAVAKGQDGGTVTAAVTWTSSDPAIVSVDTSGTVRAEAAVGTAMVTASVGDVRSPATWVVVAQPVSGAILITDAQVVDGPTTAEPSTDFDIEVVLRDAPGATTGAIVVNTESLPVAGRVVSATPEGAGQRVRLSMVPLDELFSTLDFSDTIDLTTLPLDVPDALAATYDVVRTGNRYVFTPKAASTATTSSSGAALISWVGPGSSPGAAALGEDDEEDEDGVPFGPIVPFDECKRDLGFASDMPVPLGLSVPPAFSVEIEGTLTREATPERTTFTVQAAPKFTVEAALEVKAAFEAKIECSKGVGELNFYAPGPLGLALGGDIEFEVGFEIAGEVTLTEAKVGGKAELQTTIGAILTCPANEACDIDGTSSSAGDLEPIFETPSLNQARFEPSLKLKGGLKLEAGHSLLELLQFEAIKAEAGLELAASLTLEGLQIDNTDAEEGRSRYELAFKGEVGPGIELGDFFEYLGMEEFVPLKLEFEVPLGTSPTGTVRADKARYLPGDPVEIKVTLAQASTVFPAGIGSYNVDEVFIVRRDGLTAEVLARATPDTPGDNVFELSFDAPGLIDADELYAFVVTTLLPLDPPKLEIGRASVPILYTFDEDLQGWRTFGRGRRSETEEWGEVAWRADGGGTARLSGARGDGPQNSSLFRELTLPADARTLDFRVSADLGHDLSDSQLTVRIGPAGAAAQTILLREVYENRTNSLQWTEVSLDISQWAGQEVRIVFDQRDDGEHLHEHIYLDNIGIGTGD